MRETPYLDFARCQLDTDRCTRPLPEQTKRQGWGERSCVPAARSTWRCPQRSVLCKDTHISEGGCSITDGESPRPPPIRDERGGVWQWELCRRRGVLRCISASCGAAARAPAVCLFGSNVLWNVNFRIFSSRWIDAIVFLMHPVYFQNTSINWIFFCCLRSTIKIGLLQEIVSLLTVDLWLLADAVLIASPVQNWYLRPKKCFKSK